MRAVTLQEQTLEEALSVCPSVFSVQISIGFLFFFVGTDQDELGKAYPHLCGLQDGQAGGPLLFHRFCPWSLKSPQQPIFIFRFPHYLLQGSSPAFHDLQKAVNGESSTPKSCWCLICFSYDALCCSLCTWLWIQLI